MSFLGQNFEDVFEPKSMKEGEYQLRVLDAQVKQQKPEKGTGSFVQVKFGIVGEDQAKDVSHVMMLPGAQDDVKKKNSRLSNIANFVKACGYDPSTLGNVNELIGATCWAILVEEADPEYGMQNRLRKFVVKK
jgi:hypothetical protein